MTRQFPPDPRRKARFREIARGIVAKDRSHRKYGLTVDTSGAIAQALERAYRDGVRDGPAALAPVPEQSETDPVKWALIPPRPREGFWSICLACWAAMAAGLATGIWPLRSPNAASGRSFA